MDISLSEAIDISSKIIAIYRNDFDKLNSIVGKQTLIRTCDKDEAKEISKVILHHYQNVSGRGNYKSSLQDHQTFYHFILGIHNALHKKNTSAKKKLEIYISKQSYSKFYIYIDGQNFQHENLDPLLVNSKLEVSKNTPDTTVLWFKKYGHIGEFSFKEKFECLIYLYIKKWTGPVVALILENDNYIISSGWKGRISTWDTEMELKKVTLNSKSMVSYTNDNKISFAEESVDKINEFVFLDNIDWGVYYIGGFADKTGKINKVILLVNPESHIRRKSSNQMS